MHIGVGSGRWCGIDAECECMLVWERCGPGVNVGVGVWEWVRVWHRVWTVGLRGDLNTSTELTNQITIYTV